MTLIVITLVVAIVFLHVESSNSLKVCDSFDEYFSSSSEHCFDNPDGESNTTEIIRRLGLTSEEFYITTEDGYKLVLNRAYGTITKPNPIFMVHGNSMNSRGFVQYGNRSLPYILGKLGYDVYLINLRGTWYSKQHVNLSSNDNKYWNYSFHEMAIYDVRSAMELINAKSKNQLIYIGYSMGTTISYIYSSLFPQEAKERILGIISLAPLVYMSDIRSTFQPIEFFWRPIKSYLESSRHGELPLDFISNFCPTSPITMYLCTLAIASIFGDDFNQLWDPLTTRINLKIFYDSMALGVLVHYTQIMSSNRFQHYDFGKNTNLKVYNQETPPLYDLGKILVPVAFFVGENDWLSEDKNAKRIYNEINSKCGYTMVPFNKWCHIDFISAKDFDIILAPLIIDKIRQFEKGVCNF